jgi:hypothetical protein
MPITHDDQIDLERVVSDPEYRRHVIVYLNEQAPSHRSQARSWPATAHSFSGSNGNCIAFPQPSIAPLRRFG